MDRRSIDAALRGCQLFSACDDATMEMLAAASRGRSLSPREVVIQEGAVSNSMFVIVEGILRVFNTSLLGDEPTLTLLFDGDSFGELGALGESRRMASVAALRTSVVLAIEAEVLREAYYRDPTIARALVEQLAARLRCTGERLGDMVVLDLAARLAKFLLREIRRQLDDAPRSAQIELPFTQSELGQLLGGARQSINHELAELERRGLIQLEGRRLDVLDCERLAEYARGTL